MRLTEYSLKIEKIPKKLKIALISDLHGSDIRSALKILKDTAPDLILAPGDILERVDAIKGKVKAKNDKGFELLSAASKIAPTFYSLGNHEIGGNLSWLIYLRKKKKVRALWSEENRLRLGDCGARLLDDTYLVFDGIAIGGITSGILNDSGMPHLSSLDKFYSLDCPKILLCHHPEYFKKYFADKGIDLVLSGHAHGGQWRFFGRGVFAPGQGLFPKYTKGVYENNLVVGTGLERSGLIPRIFNSPEVVVISIN